jgi:ribosomal protein L11 methyltransferase
MGFGTGHHATTRLCLAALQAIDVAGGIVIDAGTGSGILAIAARRLGAQRAVGIDNDPDAIQSAAENLELNPEAAPIEFRVADLRSVDLPQADLVTANLTGALLVGAAPALKGLLTPRGMVIASGLLTHERAAVVTAYAPADIVWEQGEDEWIGFAMRLGEYR